MRKVSKVTGRLEHGIYIIGRSHVFVRDHQLDPYGIYDSWWNFELFTCIICLFLFFSNNK